LKPIICPDCGETKDIEVVEGCIFPVLPVPDYSAECGKCNCVWTVEIKRCPVCGCLPENGHDYTCKFYNSRKDA